jgi:predicted mannosyl-3-phosphoglycerate phosphatase (HAD superfamily)
LVGGYDTKPRLVFLDLDEMLVEGFEVAMG